MPTTTTVTPSSTAWYGASANHRDSPRADSLVKPYVLSQPLEREVRFHWQSLDAEPVPADHNSTGAGDTRGSYQ